MDMLLKLIPCGFSTDSGIRLMILLLLLLNTFGFGIQPSLSIMTMRSGNSHISLYFARNYKLGMCISTIISTFK